VNTGVAENLPPRFLFAGGQGETMNKEHNGFSLIELLIVVAIILIIAAIAIPNLLRSKIAANQAGAVGTLRTISSSEEIYSAVYNNGFTQSLGTLGGPPGGVANCANAQVIDEVLSTGGAAGKSGYTFTSGPGIGVAIGPGLQPAGCPAIGLTGFSITAVPIKVNSTGNAAFCIDETGVVRIDVAGVGGGMLAACAASNFPPLQ
jgi:type IV pilus assembly protein PilA